MGYLLQQQGGTVDLPEDKLTFISLRCGVWARRGVWARKPLRKEENGTGVAEYPMTSSQSSKGVDVNSAVV
ncbi:hypothetical protein CB1_000726101 [Camelus ferus]|nr:hypothetical protein CB1_000726101 [Camelus ferus]